MSGESLEKLEAVDYPVKMSFDEQDKVYVAEFLDLPGCSAYGETVEEAYQRAQKAKAEWLRVALEEGLAVPEPSKAEEYSGRVLLRLPKSLHSMLSDKANLHGASLNQYMVHLLSGAVVGDSVSAQLDDLRNKVAQLEWRIGQLSLNLRQQYAPMSTAVVSTAVRPIGSPWFSAYENFLSQYLKPEERSEQQMAGLVSALVDDSLSPGRHQQRARTK